MHEFVFVQLCACMHAALYKNTLRDVIHSYGYPDPLHACMHVMGPLSAGEKDYDLTRSGTG